MNERSVIHKRQLTILIFFMVFTFKLSKLPPLMAENVKSSGTMTVIFYLLLEAVSFAFIYAIIQKGDFDTLENGKGKWPYKLIMAVLAAGFLFKLCLMYAGTVMFVQEQLFENISITELALTLIIPVAYIAAKGIKIISRTAEICIWYIAVALLFNLVFLKAEPDFSRNLPLLNTSFSEYVTDGSKFFFWFGDLTPFLFVTLTRGGKSKPWGMLVFSSLLVAFGFSLMYAMYGNSSMYIGNFVVKIASFNQFADKLGRLDWTGMIAWLVMAIIYLGVYLWALLEAGERVFKKRKPIFAVAVLALLAVEIFVPDLSKLISFAQGDIKYLAIAVNYVVPAILFLWIMQIKKKEADCGYDYMTKKLTEAKTLEEATNE